MHQTLLGLCFRKWFRIWKSLELSLCLKLWLKMLSLSNVEPPAHVKRRIALRKVFWRLTLDKNKKWVEAKPFPFNDGQIVFNPPKREFESQRLLRSIMRRVDWMTFINLQNFDFQLVHWLYNRSNYRQNTYSHLDAKL